MNKTQLRHLNGHAYEDVTGGNEPIFERTVERGEVQFWHQSGYGYLPESRVEIVATRAHPTCDRCQDTGWWTPPNGVTEPCCELRGSAPTTEGNTHHG